MKSQCFYVLIALILVGLLLPSLVLADSFPPVIGSIPDIIFIGNNEDEDPDPGQTLDIGFFQFPDAINMDEYVCDIDTVTSQIRWSFYEDPGGPDGAIDNFDMNDITQLASPLDALAPGMKEITGVAVPATRDPSITIWDIKACPQKDSVTSYAYEIIGGDQQLSEDIFVTFYASDGTDVDSQTIRITSVRDSWDALQQPPPFGYIFPFDDVDAEGWEPYPVPGGTVISQPGGSYTIAYTSTDPSIIVIQNQAADVNTFGSWQMKYDNSMDYALDFLYKAQYTMRTEQGDPMNSPQVRMRWFDFASLVMSGNLIDQGTNGLTDIFDTYTSYYFQPTIDGYMCRNLRLALDLVDFTPWQQGNLYCDTIEVSRIAPPTGGPTVLSYDTPAEFSDWSYFSTEEFDDASSGVGASGVWLESPGPLGQTTLYFGGFGSDPALATTTFEANKLYKAIFTLRCEDDEARKHLPMIRVRISNGTFDWVAYRNVRQSAGVISQMPTPAGRDYPLFIESPPRPVVTSRYQPNVIVLNFDIVDGSESEYGRVYLDKVVVESYPLE